MQMNQRTIDNNKSKSICWCCVLVTQLEAEANKH